MDRKKILLRVIGCFLVASMLVHNVNIGDSTEQICQVEAASKTGTIKYPAYMRKSASDKSKIYYILLRGKKVTVVSSVGNWYRVKYKNTYGYIRKLYVSVKSTSTKSSSSSKTGTVKAYYLNMRKSASTKAKIIKVLKKGAKVTILSNGTNWYKIKYAGKTGYVKKGYISTGSSSSSSKVTSSSSKTTGSSVVTYAKKFVGNRYVWGGTSLTKGADCSGFTMSVYKHFGYTIPRTSAAQRTAGRAVSSIAAAKPGDLICYSGHVAIYAGNNKIVHSANPRRGIVYGDSATFTRILAIRRII